MLDYWITTEVVRPSHRYRAPSQKREIFLFSFENLVQIKAIKALRSAGLSLQKVRDALQELQRGDAGANYHSWLVTDGKMAYIRRNDMKLESLSRPNRGQLAFAVVAVGEAHRQVKEKIARIGAVPFDATTLRGNVEPFAGLG